MTTIVTRAAKGSPLTHAEVDANFTNLNGDKLEKSNNLSELTNTTTARSNLGLGSIATQDSSNVSISGGSITGITDLAVADGGTGASTAQNARINLLPSYTGNGGKVLAVNTGATDVEWISAGGAGTVTSVDMTVPTGFAISGNPVTTSGTLALSFSSGYALPTTASQTNWDTAYTDRLKWDGGATGLNATTGRSSLGLGTIATQEANNVAITGGSITGITDLAIADGGTGASDATNARINLGATTVGSNLFTLTNPSAITFPRINADNTISALSATDFRTAIGAGTGNGDVVGPASATDNAVARFDGTTGKLIQNSAVTIADTTGDITGGAYNKVTITAPATSATLTIANGKTLTANNSLTLAGTDATTMTFPSTSQSIAGLGVAQTFTAAQTFRAASAIRSEAASTQDAMVLAGRAGGTSSYAVTLTPTTLSASRTVTFPDSNTNIPISTQTLTFSGPTAARTYTLPDANSTLAALGTAQTFTAVQTLTDPAIIGTILEDVYTISDGAAFEIDPGNGSIQLITLGASRTPKATNFAAGESVTLMVDDGTAYTLTWTDATWGGSGVVWLTNSGTAPTLATSGYTAIVLWKVSTQVYGARVGNT